MKITTRRVDDVFDYICVYARENNGITPSVRTIADALNLSPTRVQYLMLILKYDEEKLEEIPDTKNYKVVNAEWELLE